MTHTDPATTPANPLAGVSPDVLTVTNLIRTGRAVTRQTIAEATGMGRNTVSALINDAVDAGLLAPDGSAPSTGGRAPATWRFRAEAGLALSIGVHTTTLRLSVADLSGTTIVSEVVDWPITRGPEATLAEAATRLAALLARAEQARPGHGPVRVAGISLTGPVDRHSGRPIAPPIMPGWDGFDVVGTAQALLDMPVVVDNDVNVMLVGFLAGATERQEQVEDLLYVQVGTGIGAGLLASGRVHHGADGAAGDIGHVRVTTGDQVICRCGRTGCLEAVAGGWAVLRDARRAATEGVTPFLRSRLEQTGELSIEDVIAGVAAGDTECLTLTVRSATAVGNALAMLVSLLNPARVVLAGHMPQACPIFLEVAQRIVEERALGLATRNLRISVTSEGLEDERRGAAVLAVSALFDGERR
ncbi:MULTISPECIES: ROK family transcriptional regulator [unclassified Actinomyces]|uniref:ROK family transcriptional regulator n=1 Tax=unclassified Actinomyces TaxID=2609248 RepID=UPI0020181D31|nr:MULTISPECIES: ROK family transcriptional regulator [unclassified Actinomyces]MCL3777435.1 ROK family transcriptional regulator [Actinomyces sp. AC-20-1]MCL3789748.1 ROK family transcriptional regulator [Actinomyces sp. 187325]MCL3792114.1 ROK family transcriptional regulator [Actinomyces sp. 186855]MCL3794802.1 ROK family transcriptional regulator [Actinomyces sp. 217892]